MYTTQQEDFLIVMALGQLSHEFAGAEPELSNTAWNLAIAIAGEHELCPTEAVRLLE